MKIIFNTNGDVVFAGTNVPVFEIETIEAELPEGEEFDFEYSYTHSMVDGVRVAKKGEPLNIDYSERDASILATKYFYDRKNEYPAIGEQLDKLYHDIKNGTLDSEGEFFTALNAIKNKHPKPE
tara:strand:+ start:484 stop:855 length:372 start_codon:yes stop_codon:yes gene_type:complete